MVQTYVVRYGRMRFLGEYAGLPGQDHPRGQKVVVRSDRGTEVGDVLCPGIGSHDAIHGRTRPTGRSSASPRPRTGTSKHVSTEDRESYFSTCQELVAKRRLQMDLVDLEIIHGRERVVFYYLAEKRVDFRELVKDLARALRTRIEMRQIGVRDEAKLLADYGDCGKPVCCNTHLTRMPPVSMKMAKIQKTTLDPAKISGRCGRLKCCLRYEYDTYRELEHNLPAGRVDRRRPPVAGAEWSPRRFWPRSWSWISRIGGESSSAWAISSASSRPRARTVPIPLGTTPAAPMSGPRPSDLDDDDEEPTDDEP